MNTNDNNNKKNTVKFLKVPFAKDTKTNDDEIIIKKKTDKYQTQNTTQKITK